MCVLVVGATVGLYVLIDRQVNPDADYKVLFSVPANVADTDLYKMGQVLAPMVGDLDGNGKEVVVVDLGRLDRTEVDEGIYKLQFLADMDLPGLHNPNESYKYCRFCRRLPEDMAEDPEDFAGAYRVELTGASVFQAADLEEFEVYGCIAKSATDEEYEFAVELLRKILADQ